MSRYISLVFLLFISFQSMAQSSDLSEYSYVVVPNQFEFQKKVDQYQLNSMTKFYFEKNGFNAFLVSDTPNANRCDGLYADIERLGTIFGTKFQIVLTDCNKNEIYRGPEAKSKYKEFKKAYQDALRKAFAEIEHLNVQQKDVKLLTQTPSLTRNLETKETGISNVVTKRSVKTEDDAKLHLPVEKETIYFAPSGTFVLRNTGDGFALYAVAASAEKELILKGKIIVLGNLLKFMDTSGQVQDASFRTDGTLTIGTGAGATVYNKQKI